MPQVVAEKSKGSLSSAIELLRRYVDTYMLDRAAWEELGELYLQVRHGELFTICPAFVLPCHDQVFDTVSAACFDAQPFTEFMLSRHPWYIAWCAWCLASL